MLCFPFNLLIKFVKCVPFNQVLGTHESITTKIHVDHMIDSLAKHCHQLERLEFRWDNDTLREDSREVAEHYHQLERLEFYWDNDTLK